MAGGTLSREDRTTQVDSGIESVSAIAESQAVRDGRRAVPEFFAREEPGLIERGGELRKIELDLKTRAEFEITFANSSREQVAQLTAEISKVITERDKAMLAAIEQKFNSQQFAETLGQQLNAATQ